MKNSIVLFIVLFKRYLRVEWLRLLLLSAMTLVVLGLRLVAPQLLRLFVNLVENDAAMWTITYSVLGYLAVNLTRHGINTAAQYLSEVIGLRCTDALRIEIATHALSLDMSYHKEHTPGEMISRLDHDINGLSGFFAKFWNGVLTSLLSLLGTIAAVSVLSPPLGALLTASTLLILWATFRLKDIAVPLQEAALARGSEHFATMEEYLAAGEDIRGIGGVGYALMRFAQTYGAWSAAFTKAYLSSSTLWSATQLGVALNSAITFGMSYWLWHRGQADLGSVFMLVNYAEQLRMPLSQLRMRFQDLQRAEAALRRLNETLVIQPEIKDTGTASLGETACELCFENVSFGYEREQIVLESLSFILPHGQVLGLLGRTGSGKSTLARMLVRFYEPQEGRILFNGLPLQSYALGDLRRRIAYVTQEVQLFRASIRDNLTFFDPEIRDATIHAALEHLGLTDWLAALPNGLDSLLGEELGLSAGESQLLALARAFLSQPALVILDEASARLDPLTEKRLSQAMSRLMEKRTGIIIAHRLSTLGNVDKILILEQGRILEFGEHRTLRSDPTSHFARLLALGQLEVEK